MGKSIFNDIKDSDLLSLDPEVFFSAHQSSSAGDSNVSNRIDFSGIDNYAIRHGKLPKELRRRFWEHFWKKISDVALEVQGAENISAAHIKIITQAAQAEVMESALNETLVDSGIEIGESSAKKVAVSVEVEKYSLYPCIAIGLLCTFGFHYFFGPEAPKEGKLWFWATGAAGSVLWFFQRGYKENLIKLKIRHLLTPIVCFISLFWLPHYLEPIQAYKSHLPQIAFQIGALVLIPGFVWGGFFGILCFWYLGLWINRGIIKAAFSFIGKN